VRIAIIGAGAIGSLFGARLKNSGNEVLLVDRDSRTVSEIRSRGVRLRLSDGKTSRVHVPIKQAPASLRDFEQILFAVKAYSTEEAARQYRTLVEPEATIVTLQNGLGNLDVLARCFGKERVVAGSTTEASLLLGPGWVTHAGGGRTVVGELDGTRSKRCLDIVGMFREAGFETVLTRNVMGVVWAKVIVNSAINPVSALTRLRNGQLAGEEVLKDLMLRTLSEGVETSRAERVKLEPEGVALLLFRILRATAQNQSSMLQDVLNERRTEIRQLNGAIVEKGRQHRVSTPYNELLTSLILGLERSRAKEGG